MNTEALKVVETVLFSLAGASLFSASQLWLYRYGYRNGKEVGEHLGFTKGLYTGKLREHHRLTREAKRDKITTWTNSTGSALSTR